MFLRVIFEESGAESNDESRSPVTSIINRSGADYYETTVRGYVYSILVSDFLINEHAQYVVIRGNDVVVPKYMDLVLLSIVLYIKKEKAKTARDLERHVIEASINDMESKMAQIAGTEGAVLNRSDVSLGPSDKNTMRSDALRIVMSKPFDLRLESEPHLSSESTDAHPTYGDNAFEFSYNKGEKLSIYFSTGLLADFVRNRKELFIASSELLKWDLLPTELDLSELSHTEARIRRNLYNLSAQIKINNPRILSNGVHFSIDKVLSSYPILTGLLNKMRRSNVGKFSNNDSFTTSAFYATSQSSLNENIYGVSVTYSRAEDAEYKEVIRDMIMLMVCLCCKTVRYVGHSYLEVDKAEFLSYLAKGPFYDDSKENE